MVKKLIAVLAVGLVLVFAWIAFKSGVRVSIENVGHQTMTDVIVRVAGSELEVDDVEPGETLIVKVSPVGQTKRVEVIWKDGEGRECYGKHEVIFEDSGYNGVISFAVDGASVTKTEDTLDTGFF